MCRYNNYHDASDSVRQKTNWVLGLNQHTSFSVVPEKQNSSKKLIGRFQRVFVYSAWCVDKSILSWKEVMTDKVLCMWGFSWINCKQALREK